MLNTATLSKYDQRYNFYPWSNYIYLTIVPNTREKPAAKNGTKREVSKQYFYDCMGREGRFYKIFVHDCVCTKWGLPICLLLVGEVGNIWRWMGNLFFYKVGFLIDLWSPASSFVCLCHSHGPRIMVLVSEMLHIIFLSYLYFIILSWQFFFFYMSTQRGEWDSN